MRIAVCDDCREDALLLKEYLAGHEISVYADAESLLTDVEENNKQFDLYLLDIFMEESMNGIELAKRLRRGQEEALLCFVSTSDDFYREAYDLYAVQYLIKPVGGGKHKETAAKGAGEPCGTFRQPGENPCLLMVGKKRRYPLWENPLYRHPGAYPCHMLHGRQGTGKHGKIKRSGAADMRGHIPALPPEFYRQHIPCGGHERL